MEEDKDLKRVGSEILDTDLCQILFEIHKQTQRDDFDHLTYDSHRFTITTTKKVSSHYDVNINDLYLDDFIIRSGGTDNEEICNLLMDPNSDLVSALDGYVGNE